MNRKELVELLQEVASYDLADGSNIYDHPCSVAIRAIDKAFEDIETLRRIAPKKTGSKKVQMLTGLSHNPSW